MPQRVVTSAALQHDDRDLPIRLALVVLVVRPLADHLLPQRRLLVGRRDAGARREHVVEHLHLDVRVRLEVDVPGRGLVGPALGGHDDVGLPGRAVDQRRRAGFAARAPLRGEQEDRGALLPVVAELAPRLAVGADVLVAEEVGCILCGHGGDVPRVTARVSWPGPMTRHDAVIVGGGHNGLVAAAYLARAGRSVLVLERRDHPGGAAVSERPWPGVDARLSRYSYLVSLLPAAVVRDLGLGVELRRRAISSYTPRPGGGGLLVRTDAVPHDAWREFYAMTARVGRRVFPTLTRPLPTRDALRAEVAEDAAWAALF